MRGDWHGVVDWLLYGGTWNAEEDHTNWWHAWALWIEAYLTATLLRKTTRIWVKLTLHGLRLICILLPFSYSHLPTGLNDTSVKNADRQDTVIREGSNQRISVELYHTDAVCIQSNWTGFPLGFLLLFDILAVYFVSLGPMRRWVIVAEDPCYKQKGTLEVMSKHTWYIHSTSLL